MSKNKKTTKRSVPKVDQQTTGLPRLQRKRSFKDFRQLADYAKGTVYFIARIREQKDGTALAQSLGTAFLIGENRMMTCAHCINDPKNPTVAIAQHAEGDSYLLLQKDEFDNYHYVIQNPVLGESLFIHEDIDTAVIYLDESFYTDGNQYYHHPDLYLELETKPVGIGTDIAILGYPFPELVFDSNGYPDISNIVIRGDRGVINTRRANNSGSHYETTTGFNPGNSGGPIFDLKTGAVIGIVTGYIPVPMHWMKDQMKAGEHNHANDATYYHKLRCIYSYGFSSDTLAKLAQQHGLATR